MFGHIEEEKGREKKTAEQAVGEHNRVNPVENVVRLGGQHSKVEP